MNKINFLDILPELVGIFIIIVGIICHIFIPSYHCPKCEYDLQFRLDEQYCPDCGYKLDSVSKYNYYQYKRNASFNHRSRRK